MFIAAGKIYLSEFQLVTVPSQEHRCKEASSYWVRLSQDAFGREVLCVSERFPTFDSYDALYEDRYYRWYYIRHQGGLTLVYTQDDSDKVKVTENITAESCDGIQSQILRCEGWL